MQPAKKGKKILHNIIRFNRPYGSPQKRREWRCSLDIPLISVCEKMCFAGPSSHFSIGAKDAGKIMLEIKILCDYDAARAYDIFKSMYKINWKVAHGITPVSIK